MRSALLSAPGGPRSLLHGSGREQPLHPAATLARGQDPADPGVEVDHGAFAVQLILAARDPHVPFQRRRPLQRSEEHTSELQSLMRISYAVFCLKKKK